MLALKVKAGSTAASLKRWKPTPRWSSVCAPNLTEGLEATLARKKRQKPPIEPIFDGEAQAQLIALACSEPPEGYAHWTIRLLAEKVIERKIVGKAHFNTVGRVLKKTLSSRI